jgi:hypothetical protein
MEVFQISIDGPLRVFGFVGRAAGVFPFVDHLANDGGLVAYAGTEVLNGSYVGPDCFVSLYLDTPDCTIIGATIRAKD